MIILKWRDSRDVTILSTKYAPIIVTSPKNIRNIRVTSTSQQSYGNLKPLTILVSR